MLEGAQKKINKQIKKTVHWSSSTLGTRNVSCTISSFFPVSLYLRTQADRSDFSGLFQNRTKKSSEIYSHKWKRIADDGYK